ncbi:MAG: pentapeptide repeat-containing protein [Rhodobacteraceae bacterium]|nr:pentapeptide repeat-containing protein [Paracoccaceae bacterium]
MPKEDGTGSVERSLPNIEVRIGGLLSLERIAQDSTIYDNGRDHVRVMEILCAYVRENAKASEAEISKREIYESETEDSRDSPGMTSEQIAEEYGSDFEDEAKDIDVLKEWAQSLPPPREDIAIALRIIGRRGPDQLRVEAGWGNNTPNAEWVFNKACPHLPDEPGKAALTKEKLETFTKELKARQDTLENYKGYRLDLRMTNLQGADLSTATLAGANLEGVRMAGVDLSKSQLTGAALERARMEGANLFFAQMEGANLSRAQMEGADLGQARMIGVNLSDARMEGADLSDARMEGANLLQARMKGANLWQVKLSSADLRGWTIARTSLRSADLGDYTTLTQDGVNAAWGDGSKRLPPHITRPDHWPDTALANSWDDDPAYDAWIAAGAPPGTPRAP